VVELRYTADKKWTLSYDRAGVLHRSMETVRTVITWIFGVLATDIVLVVTENLKELIKQRGGNTLLVRCLDKLPARDWLNWATVTWPTVALVGIRINRWPRSLALANSADFQSKGRE